MSREPQLFRIDPSTDEPAALQEVDFAQVKLREVRDIQAWVAANPNILDSELLIVAKEFSGFDRTSERLDLLAVDRSGKLVVIELKRDDTGADAYWQAIKYASYLRRADKKEIVALLARHKNITEDEAEGMLLRHLDADDLESLNGGQRIVLASHRFAPEVTSAALWLNEQVSTEGLITCVQLIPYRDAESDSLYLQANTIIPIPGEEDYEIRIGNREADGGDRGFAESLQRTYDRNRGDDVTRFLRSVADRVVSDLPVEVRPDRRSRWAGGWAGGAYDHRYYRFWYRRPPWSNWDFSYRMNLYRQDHGSVKWKVDVVFGYFPDELRSKIDQLDFHEGQIEGNYVLVTHTGDSFDDVFASRLAETLTNLIKAITPLVDRFQEESNQEEA